MPCFDASDGTRLFYRDSGAGLPLICLHGLTRNSSDFDLLRPLLPGCRIIALDARGRGRSARGGAASYTVARESEDVLNLLDHLGIGAAAFLGASRGGMVAMALAARAPRRILGLCLNDIGPEMEPEGRMRITTYVGLQPEERSIEERAAAMPRHHPGFVGVPESRWREEVRHHFVETPEGLRITYDPALRDAFMATLHRAPDMWHGFDALAGRPVAVIRGANSDILSRRIVAEMARRRPDLIRAEVPDRGHMPFLDEPESLGALRTFLTAVEESKKD
ncbi:hydrolase [Pannonibacter phragmitetus]|jgi:pimeloyl-ACP methyl ester carboxylesterase|uniref:alpha/beta fold hydrolase n=1 Tax=Pannonibacter phragmitetus TaxID=121719 RepID=UPI00067B96F8|nr:alpha/beta hydrolase [Pannonibacter phragmitetus]KND16148.1 hydrolase [Pannonibacter phragmitetus]